MSGLIGVKRQFPSLEVEATGVLSAVVTVVEVSRVPPLVHRLIK
jgi:hypothetical protein